MNLSRAPLAGVRVLDLSRVLAGPFATQQLADLGADVIKVEEPRRGDATRQWGPPFDDQGRSAYFLCCNRGKRSVALDLSRQPGRNLLEQLVARSDLVVENFLPHVWEHWGVSLQQWRQRHPHLVTLTISGFGSDGPWHDRAGYDAVIQGMSGLMAITGTDQASKVGVAIVDVATGLFAASGVLALLYGVARHPEGWSAAERHVEVTLYDTALAILANVTSGALLTGEEPDRHGNAHPNIVPYQTFEAADGEVVLGIGNDRQWQHLAQSLERQDWLDNDLWSTNPGRVRDRAQLVPALAQEIRRHPRAALVQRLAPAGIAIGGVNSVQAGLHEAVVTARGSIVEHADGTLTVGSPIRTPRGVRDLAPPPALGADSTAILTELGHSGGDIGGWIAEGIVVQG